MAAKFVDKPLRKQAGGVSPRAQTACRHCPRLTNPSFRNFSKTELTFMQQLKSGEVSYKAGDVILQDGQKGNYVFTVLEGWAIRYKLVSDGGRQILNVSLPGDLIGLQASMFGEMQHSIEAITDLRLCILPKDRLFELYSAHPSLAFDVTWLAAKEEAIVSELMANVGQQPAFVRMAFIFAHIFHRAERADLTDGNVLTFPLRQEDIADMLGLSMVHTNKTLRRLRATNCIAWTRGHLVIQDIDKLHEISKFMPEIETARPFL